MREEMVHLSTLKIKLIIFFVVVFGGCSALPQDRNWEDVSYVMYQPYKLRTGDIIVKNKRWDPLSWYGHAAVMIDDINIGDYPKMGVGYYEVDSYSWLYENRKVMVFRYKNFDQKFKEAFLKNLMDVKDGKYRVVFNKKNNRRFYCSQFVWYLYWKTAKDLGYELDLDSDKGIMVMPYDFIESPYLEQIPFSYDYNIE
jgi:uncharacterized protein YycO